MEKNTFAISAYIAAPLDLVHGYLCDLRNLNEWTLFSRMKEKVDEDTWKASSSGYQHDLYYHVRRSTETPFRGVEWHCGIRYGDYFQVYPTFVFPPDYIEPRSDESGAYFHWVSFIDPARRTPMIGEGLEVVHTSECRALKGVLERKVGRTERAVGRHEIKTATIYIDAPLELGVEYVGDLRNMGTWSHLLRQHGEIRPEAGTFLDEYGQRAEITLRAHAQPKYVIIEQDAVYPDHAFVQRSPMLLIPCSYAFGNPRARGFMLHRITFWRRDELPRHGKLQIEDFCAEMINAKRIIEAKAGNLDTFARGLSYLPPE